MRAIRSGRGIGDNIYLQSIVRHLTQNGEKLEVCTDWPDLFRPIANRVRLSPHRKSTIDIVSHYVERKAVSGTDQFQDCCLRAGITEPVDLRIDWNLHLNGDLIDGLRAAGKPVIVVTAARAPFGRADGFGLDLLPDCDALQDAILAIGGRATVAQIGAGAMIRKFRGVDIDLVNKTTVTDLIDIGSVASGFLGYCSYLVPLAESFKRPALFVWSSRGLRSRTEYIRSITPKKILHRASSRFVMDDATQQEISGAVDALCDAAGCSRAFRGQASGDRRQWSGRSGE